VRDEDPYLAALISDVHLSHRPPLVRTAEDDWYNAMARPLNEVGEICRKKDIPLVIAGDIFHTYNPPPQLVNFAIDVIPRPAFAIPGQHDLPNHRYDDKHRSAYWTLMQTRGISNLGPGLPWHDDGLILYGFPWGFPITPCTDHPQAFTTRLAVCHRYIWGKGTGHPDANESDHISKVSGVLATYDAAVFGDNHTHFMKGNVLNCGCLIRRRADEIAFEPRVGLLRASGKIDLVKLESGKHDKFITATDAIARIVEAGDHNIEEFMEQLMDVEDAGTDFCEAIRRFMNSNGVSDRVRKIITDSMERR
jgi:hypothetical protein